MQKKKSIIILIFLTSTILSFGQNAKPYNLLEDVIPNEPCISKEIADSLFTYFKTNPLFDWSDHNNCEDRANAICILLDKWNIPNCKGWVIVGSILDMNNNGKLKDNWEHHITAVIPVYSGGETKFYVIDPATQSELALLEDWAESVSLKPSCYYFKKLGENVDVSYNLGSKMTKDSWYKRNQDNYKWTMEGLAGVNGVGKWKRPKDWFTKLKVNEVTYKFEQLSKPNFLK